MAGWYDRTTFVTLRTVYGAKCAGKPAPRPLSLPTKGKHTGTTDIRPNAVEVDSAYLRSSTIRTARPSATPTASTVAIIP